jgi:hypothetical protein
MSYELYPHLLELGIKDDMSQIAEVISRSNTKSLSQNLKNNSLKTYAIRCHRGGLSLNQVGNLIGEVLNEGLHFSTLSGRMRMIEKCALLKMRNEGKSIWGMKCTSKYAEYLEFWPQARFINMLRDGRDVLASQLNTGSFDKSSTDIAKAWVGTHSKFGSLIEDNKLNGQFVRYESLTREPETELKRICTTLGVKFDKRILNHSNQDLTIFASRHLSGDRINKKIDTKSIGRWKDDLSDEQLAEFTSFAKEALEKYDYN